MMTFHHSNLTITTTRRTSSLVFRLLFLGLICFTIGFQYYGTASFFNSTNNIIIDQQQKQKQQEQQRRDNEEEEEGQKNHAFSFDNMSPTAATATATATTTTTTTTTTTNSSNKEEFRVTFLGDTMFSTQPMQYAEMYYFGYWKMGEGFDNLVPLRGDYIIANLEGLITDEPLPLKLKNPINFGMKPGVEYILKDKLHIDAVNQANNHVADRGIRGFYDTQQYLDSVGIAYFGAGLTTEEAAKPHVFELPFISTGRYRQSSVVGISSFHADSGGYYFSKEDGNDDGCHDQQHQNETKKERPQKIRGALDPGNKTHIELAIKLQREANASIKIAFVHWGHNYKPITDKMRYRYAPYLAKAGYDMIIGSDGTHTVLPFDYVDGYDVPVLFDIGNFNLENPTRFHFPKFNHTLPYGSVTSIVFDKLGLNRIEIQCTVVAFHIVKYHPRYCNLQEESMELFSSLGKYVQYTKGDKYATIDLRTRGNAKTTTTTKTAS